MPVVVFAHQRLDVSKNRGHSAENAARFPPSQSGPGAAFRRHFNTTRPLFPDFVRRRSRLPMKRLFDLSASALALLLLSPLLTAAALAVRLSSPGPVLYKARRVGRMGQPFVMFKFRTMHAAPVQGSVITSSGDARIFPVGRLLRALKIDELPQLWNILRGEMSIVGPRPEDPKIVAEHYGHLGHETLTVLPGLTCPGSIHFYTHGEQLVDDSDPETAYVRNLLPIKLALDAVYVRHQSLLYDIRLIIRTALTILQIAAGRQRFPEPAEMPEALRILNSTHTAAHTATPAAPLSTTSAA